MTTVALAEDHTMFREAMASYINGVEGYQVIAHAPDGASLIDCIRQTGYPDILILDVEMPVMNGYETALWFQKEHPLTKILVLSVYDSELLMVRFLKAGVRGFVRKDGGMQVLFKAMEHIRTENAYYLGHDKVPDLFKYISDGRKAGEQGLNDRELEFIKISCEGGSYREISKKLDMSLRSINTMMDTVCKKLGAENRVQLAVCAMKSGVLKL